ncbi:MAG TPA: hypothetical protein VFD71_02790 [Planctomycetota bacterium]|nr:hypothetical protein [Planctomycetota bacterium]
MTEACDVCQIVLTQRFFERCLRRGTVCNDGSEGLARQLTHAVVWIGLQELNQGGKEPIRIALRTYHCDEEARGGSDRIDRIRKRGLKRGGGRLFVTAEQLKERRRVLRERSMAHACAFQLNSPREHTFIGTRAEV